VDSLEPSAAPGSSPAARAELYAARAERFRQDAERLGARSRRVANLRGLSFGVAVIAGLFAAFGKHHELSGAIASAGAVVFLALVAWHARVIDAEDDAWRHARVNHDAHARVTGRWRAFHENGARFQRVAPGCAEDLDVFGPSSLFQRISVAHTRFGQDALARMLNAPAELETIALRQEAARALGAEIDVRQRLEALAIAVNEIGEARPAAPVSAELGANAAPPRRAPRPPPDPEPLLAWAESEPELSKQTGLVWAARVLPPLTLLAVAASIAFQLSPLVWCVPLVVQIGLSLHAGPPATRVFNAVSSTEGAFLRYGAMLELIEKLDVDSELIRQTRERMLSGERRPSQSMKEFRGKVGWFDLRHNGLVYPFINPLLLWDVHCTLALEDWQKKSGHAARGWFEALGEVEALSSLAGLHYDEPGYAFAEVVSGPACFEAEALGHPLIDDPERVTNNVALSEPGTALLVTGSNMSGKSTLLRSMGLASVMAFAGGPACATRLKLARLSVGTSIRVSDSLDRRVSHFYAELAKLKAVLDATGGELPVLFLLDEILHGTNSRERQIGARWVISELLRRGALGAVSTHDMALARVPDELAERVQLVHFRENVENGRMTFDFKLRPGAVTAGNALRLMRLVGLDVPPE
jgi:energy-coupling factor transporter ATP-binding protein EcfA2